MPKPIDPIIETDAFRKGHTIIAGVDEVGVGSAAGPLVACCVLFDDKILSEPGELAVDSKKIRNRDTMRKTSKKLRDLSIGHAIGWVLPENLQHLGHASVRAMTIAVDRATSRFNSPTIVFSDHHDLDLNGIEVVPIDKGDAKVRAIAAASVIAKSFRDRFMVRLHESFPSYAWNQNVGYFTEKHKTGVKKNGTNRWHRKKYIPEDWMPK